MQKRPCECCVSKAVQSVTSVRACALPILCKRAAVCRQAAMHFKAEGVSTCCHRRRGCTECLLRIPEEASQELTGEGTKYVFALRAEPGRI